MKGDDSITSKRALIGIEFQPVLSEKYSSGILCKITKPFGEYICHVNLHHNDTWTPAVDSHSWGPLELFLEERDCVARSTEVTAANDLLFIVDCFVILMTWRTASHIVHPERRDPDSLSDACNSLPLSWHISYMILLFIIVTQSQSNWIWLNIHELKTVDVQFCCAYSLNTNNVLLLLVV